MGDFQQPGRIVDDLFITALFDTANQPIEDDGAPSPLSASADGISYPGLLKINDGQAEYLYGRFAHGFFTLDPDAAPPPLEFKPARYAEVASLPATELAGLIPNRDRERRVAEMKLLVIEFFRIFSENPAAIGGAGGQEAREILRPLLELAPDADPVGDLLDFLPPISEPDAPDAEEGDVSDPLADPLVSLLEASSERAGRDAAAKLASMVTDLDLMITKYQSEAVATSEADSAPTAAGEELLLRSRRSRTRCASSTRSSRASRPVRRHCWTR